ncbi:DUF488 domain-containing protein [Paenibacillus sp. CAU 1782]
MPFVIKRIYEDPDDTDGKRILVDRLWPRGVKKSDAKLYLWMKEVTPSPSIRIWFGHQPDRLEVFADLYREELSQVEMAPYVEQLLEWASQGSVTLLYAAKDKACNHAMILKQFLERRSE